MTRLVETDDGDPTSGAELRHGRGSCGGCSTSVGFHQCESADCGNQHMQCFDSINKFKIHSMFQWVTSKGMDHPGEIGSLLLVPLRIVAAGI